MTNFTVSDSWASQGTVNGTATFTPYPTGVGEPVIAQISSGALSATLPVGEEPDVRYEVAFSDVIWNGWPAQIPNFAFTAPEAAATISLRALSSGLDVAVSEPITPPAQGSGGITVASCVGTYSDNINVNSGIYSIPETAQTIIAPPSGIVIVTYSVFLTPVTACSCVMAVQFNNVNDTNDAPQFFDFLNGGEGDTITQPFRATGQQICTGLTPDATYFVQPQAFSDQDDTTSNIQPGSGYNAYSIIQLV